MKGKVLWLILSCLILLALVLASCQPAVVEEEEEVVPVEEEEEVVPVEEEEEVAPVEKGPQYGGTIAIYVTQTGGFDPANVFNFWPSWILIYDGLVCEDWAKGPSGTGEGLLGANDTPDEFFIGWLAESWEQTDLYTVIYHLRQGVRFQDKPPVNGREFNADDVVYNLNRFKEHEKSSWYQSEVTVTKLDKYTVRFDSPEPNATAWKGGWTNMVIGAPEVAEEYGDMTDWRTVVGTGPFTVVDVVPESSITYEKNPNYWLYDPLHPGNRLPYLDGLKALVIVDPATQEAALRTGKIDRHSVGREAAESIRATTPELMERRVFSVTSTIIHMRTDQELFGDRKVRQALSMAIDREAIAVDYYGGEAEILTWPYMPTAGEAYTPLDELPPEVQELYQYNPEKAKQLLAEAGYPNGFKTEITCRARNVEILSIVKSYFDAIGVETELNVVESGAYWSVVVGHTYKDMSISSWGNTLPIYGLVANQCGYIYNYSVVCDERIDERREKILETLDPQERARLYKEIGPYIIEQQYYIQLPVPFGYIFWQPWLKGYSGEIAFGTVNGWYGMYRFVWVDHELREKMGH